MATWIEAVDSGEKSIETTSFLMVTNTTVSESIARRIARAETKNQISTCIAELQTVGANPPNHIVKLVKRVLRPKSSGTLRAVIQRIDLSDACDGAASVDLRKKTIGHLQLPDWCSGHCDSIASELLGWLHTEVMSAWQNNRPAWIERDHFVNQLHAIIGRRKREVARERAELLIPVADEHVGRESGRPFVKQLHLVTEDDAVVDTAIREFIRCNIEKARLSREGDITDLDWKTFEETLLARWNKIRSRVGRMRAGADESDIGFEIFTETTENHKERLAGTDTEQVYLTSGTYHRLSDLLSVGWHPRYKALMRELLGR
ncbi:MAG TPA: ABC-three component system protein [Candidatus Acidoferrales bacterium]|nr:ABC-three component system protein [Candidatus Acidoferrales bacterium]